MIDFRGVNLPPLMFDGRESGKPYVALEGHIPSFPYHFIFTLRHHSISAFLSHLILISCFTYIICILLCLSVGVLIVVASPEGLTRPPFHEAIQLPFRECTKGESFGPSWSTHWFRITLRIPHEFLTKVISLPRAIRCLRNK